MTLHTHNAHRNDLVLSRHRTIDAAAKAHLKHGRELARYYGPYVINTARLRVQPAGIASATAKMPEEWEQVFFHNAIKRLRK